MLSTASEFRSGTDPLTHIQKSTTDARFARNAGLTIPAARAVLSALIREKRLTKHGEEYTVCVKSHSEVYDEKAVLDALRQHRHDKPTTNDLAITAHLRFDHAERALNRLQERGLVLRYRNQWHQRNPSISTQQQLWELYQK